MYKRRSYKMLLVYGRGRLGPRPSRALLTTDIHTYLYIYLISFLFKGINRTKLLLAFNPLNYYTRYFAKVDDRGAQ